MVTVVVPFHQDERLPAGDLPAPVGDTVVVAPDLPGADMWARVRALHEHVAEAVATAAGAGRPAVLSGDCLVATPVLTGLQRAGLRPSVVWFDAHGDVHTLQTSTSGYPGGLSLQLLFGTHPELLSGPLGLVPLGVGQAVLVDARDLDPAEAEYLATGGPARIGVGDVRDDLLPAGPLFLHVDLDVIDSGSLPGLRFPAAGGPSPEAVLAAAARVVETGRVVGVHVSAPWLPTDDPDQLRARAAVVRALLDLAS